MTSPRDRRLINEATLLRAAFAGSPVVEVTPIGWDPFQAYRVVFSVPGVVLDHGSQPIVSEQHIVLVRLGSDYPRLAPSVATETEVFHPNFGPTAGDTVAFDREWTAASTLTDVVIRIGRMLQYQTFDLVEPANEVAADWAGTNKAIFPIGHVEIEAPTPYEGAT